MEKMSSIGIRKRLVNGTRRQGYILVYRIHQLVDLWLPTALSPFKNPPRAEPRTTGTSSPGSCTSTTAPGLPSPPGRSVLSSSTASHLFKNNHDVGNAYLAGQPGTCSLGLGHRANRFAATTRIAPSICAAPGDHVLDVIGVTPGSPRAHSDGWPSRTPHVRSQS